MASLVTGIGYIGAKLVEHLLDSGESVVGLDSFFSTDRAAVEKLAEHPRFTFVEGDIREWTEVRRAFEVGAPIETVYHMAAQASGHPTAAPTRFTEETNLIGPRIVLQQSAEAGVRTFVFGGSVQVYGRRVEGVVDESRPYGPILDLSHLSKAYVEKLMEMFAHTRGLRCLSARLGLVYGLSPVMKTDPRFMTAPNRFCRQVALGEASRVDASAYYPTGMIHVADAARGLAALAKWPEDGYAAVNLVGETASVAEVAWTVRRLAAERGLEAKIEFPADPPVPPSVRFTSSMSRVGFAPERSLEVGPRETLTYFLQAAR